MLASLRRSQSRTLPGDENESRAAISCASARRASSKLAFNCAALAMPMPETLASSSSEASTRALRLAVEALQQFAGEIDGALAAHADAQIDRQQFGVGQRLRPVRQQSFAGPLAFRPVGDRHAHFQ